MAENEWVFLRLSHPEKSGVINPINGLINEPEFSWGEITPRKKRSDMGPYLEPKWGLYVFIGIPAFVWRVFQPDSIFATFSWDPLNGTKLLLNRGLQVIPKPTKTFVFSNGSRIYLHHRIIPQKGSRLFAEFCHASHRGEMIQLILGP